jgi:archaellum biogenesis protein FlaJ (TadC family)
MVALGIYPSITPHVFILGVVGSLSSILSTKFNKFFKHLTLATSICYLVVFLWILTIPGNILMTILSCIALMFTALFIIGLLVVKEG